MLKLLRKNKKKWFTSLVVGLTLLIYGCIALPTTPTTGDIPPQIIEWSHTNVWKVLTGSGGHGSGFWINNRQLITACHVVDELLEGIVISNTGKTEKFTVKTCDPILDIAILERDFSEYSEFRANPTLISWILPKEGTRVYGAGYPLWLPLTINDGHFGGLVTTPWSEDERLYSNSVPIYDGDSGSPLLSIRNGKIYIEGVRVALAGVAGDAQSIFVPHLAMAATGRQVLEELREYNLNKQKGEN